MSQPTALEVFYTELSLPGHFPSAIPFRTDESAGLASLGISVNQGRNPDVAQMVFSVSARERATAAVFACKYIRNRMANKHDSLR
jgi:hypothetical protein